MLARIGTSAILLLGLALAAPGRCEAQSTGHSMEIDPSIISAGMGEASAAVTWSAEPDYWANPALLGYYRGLRWQWGSTRLLPELASDLKFETRRLTVASWGIGIESAGDPLDGFGRLRLDYGASEGTDPQGNPTGTFRSYEQIDAFGVGVSLAQLASSLMALRGSELPAFARHFDLAFGYARKHTVIALAPASGLGIASGTTHDRGLLVRAGIGSDDLGWRTLPGLQFDVSYGQAVLNYDDTQFYFAGNNVASPASRMFRDGGAARVALVRHPECRAGDSQLRAALAGGFEPFAALGYAYDHERVLTGNYGGGIAVSHHGMELTLLNVVSLRVGHVTDKLDNIDGFSMGIGVSLPLGEFAGLRYDYARYPEPNGSGLADQRRHAYSFFMDPLALRRALQ